MFSQRLSSNTLNQWVFHLLPMNLCVRQRVQFLSFHMHVNKFLVIQDCVESLGLFSSPLQMHTAFQSARNVWTAYLASPWCFHFQDLCLKFRSIHWFPTDLNQLQNLQLAELGAVPICSLLCFLLYWQDFLIFLLLVPIKSASASSSSPVW